MRNKRAFFVAAIALAIGLLGTGASPVHAVTSGKIVVQGTLTIGGGLSYTCVGNGGPDTTACPVIGSGVNGVTVTFGGTGAGQLRSAAEPKCGGLPVCVEAGTWAITANGTISGHCNLWSATLNGAMNPSLSLGTKSKPRNFGITISSAFFEMVITGSTSKGETIIGEGQAVPDALSGASCLNRLPKSFVVVMTLEFAKT